VPASGQDVELVAVVPVPRGERHQHHRHNPAMSPMVLVGLLSPPATTLREKATVFVIDQTGLPLYPRLTGQELPASSLRGGCKEPAKFVDQ